MSAKQLPKCSIPRHTARAACGPKTRAQLTPAVRREFWAAPHPGRRDSAGCGGSIRSSTYLRRTSKGRVDRRFRTGSCRFACRGGTVGGPCVPIAMRLYQCTCARSSRSDPVSRFAAVRDEAAGRCPQAAILDTRSHRDRSPDFKSWKSRSTRLRTCRSTRCQVYVSLTRLKQSFPTRPTSKRECFASGLLLCCQTADHCTARLGAGLESLRRCSDSVRFRRYLTRHRWLAPMPALDPEETWLIAYSALGDAMIGPVRGNRSAVSEIVHAASPTWCRLCRRSTQPTPIITRQQPAFAAKYRQGTGTAKYVQASTAIDQKKAWCPYRIHGTTSAPPRQAPPRTPRVTNTRPF
jgi:hypothetical protein